MEPDWMAETKGQETTGIIDSKGNSDQAGGKYSLPQEHQAWHQPATLD